MANIIEIDRPNNKIVLGTTDTTINIASHTASLLLSLDASKNLESVSDLTSWIAGTANQIIVTDDGDGTITLSSPQSIGTGSSPTFADLTLTGTLNCRQINPDNHDTYNIGESDRRWYTIYVYQIEGVLGHFDYLTLDTSQGVTGLTTTDHPTFDYIVLSTQQGITGLGMGDHPTFDYISLSTTQGITGLTTSDSPTFNNLTLTGTANIRQLNPDNDNTYDIGESDRQWKNLYLSGDAIINGTTLANTYQPLDAVLTDLAALDVVADNEFIVGTGTGTYAHEGGATARTSIGLGTGDSPLFTGLSLSGIIEQSTDTDKFLVLATGVVKYRTGAQVLSDIGGGITAAELEELSDGSETTLHSHAASADVKVGVDVGATADYIGAASNDGVLRTTTGLSYADGGDFVTLGLSFLGLEALSDPGGDRLLFWDDSETAFKWNNPSTGLSIDATSLGLNLGALTEETTPDNLDVAVIYDPTGGAHHKVQLNNLRRIIQVVNTQTGAVNTGTTAIPHDDTIPQNDEGDEYMTLAITPTSTTNKLKIDVVFQCAHSAATRVAVALFQDAGADAIAAGMQYSGATHEYPIKFTHYMDAGTTSETTFKVRAGGDTGATLTFNGVSGARKYGGVLASSITITETKV